jgi:hypothetical protein
VDIPNQDVVYGLGWLSLAKEPVDLRIRRGVTVVPDIVDTPIGMIRLQVRYILITPGSRRYQGKHQIYRRQILGFECGRPRLRPGFGKEFYEFTV